MGEALLEGQQPVSGLFRQQELRGHGGGATAMDHLAFLDPLRELFDNDEAVEKAEAVVRGFFSNSNVTVNLIPAILAGLGALLFLLPLLGIPILDVLFGAMTGASTGAGYSSSISYSARSGEGVELTPEQKALFPELTDLRQQIENLQESEKSLREQIYFNTAAAHSEGQLVNTADINQISYTY